MKRLGLLTLIWITALPAFAVEQSEILYLYDRMPEPIRFGVLDLEEVLRDKGLVVRVRDMFQAPGETSVFRVTVGDLLSCATLPEHPLATNLSISPGSAGSFEIRVRKAGESSEVLVAGSDPAGAMYGLQEVAEQVDRAGTQRAPYQAVRDGVHIPYLGVRGAQILIQRQALEDPWSWFYSEDFWQGWMDLLARGRFNVLDLHGVYDLISTQSHNILPYFTYLDAYPEVGVGALQAEQNAAMLNRIVELARNRGIRVFLVSYDASWRIPGHPDPSQEETEETEETLGAYSTQAWEQLVQSCPELSGAGFRVGESGRGVLFYQRYVIPAIEKAEGSIPLIMRSWLLKRDDITALAGGHSNATAVEVKFNGDFLGLPYQVPAGRYIGWEQYTYDDLLTQPRNYDVIYEIRAAGEHRIFPWADPDSIRRVVESCHLGNGVGMTLQPIGAYGPLTDTYTNTAYEDLSYWTWTFERDWYWWLMWGRLAYSPDVPREVLEHRFQRHFSFLPTASARSMLQALIDMSQVVPAIYATSCVGPDRRNTAPELETSVSISDQFQSTQPQDETTIQSLLELATLRVEGTTTGKRSPLDILTKATSKAAQAQRTLEQVMTLRPAAKMGTADVLTTPLERKGWKEIRAWQLDAEALRHLSTYHLTKAASAYRLGMYRLTGNHQSLWAAKEGVQSASREWAALSLVTDRRYKAFPDLLRMKTTQFHWLNHIDDLDENCRVLDQEEAEWDGLATDRRWRPTFGHVRPDHPRPGKDLTLELSFPPNVPVSGLKARYRNSAGQGESLDAQEVQMPNYFVVKIPGDKVTEGLLEYFFSAEIAGNRVESPTLMGGRYYRLFVTDDSAPPHVLHSSSQVSEEGGNLILNFDINDPSKVEKVRLWYKAIPSSRPWEVQVLAGTGNIYTGRIPSAPEGMLYFLEATDAVGNAAIYPDPEVATPYWVHSPSR